ncbi:MAG: BREX system P-loop protein BrxC, partial [Muribaculum sp.]|nr:BREX system P-loop protein BrxC [Muribaculum sp.]
EDVLNYLCDSNVIRREQPKKNIEETFAFYTEEEMKVAAVIKSQQVDHNTRAEQLKEIFLKHFSNLKNKETYISRSFPISANIMGRTFLANNGDVTVEFKLDNEGPADQVAFTNTNQPRLIFYLAPAYQQNHRLQVAFHDYCQMMKYMAIPPTSEENERIRAEFSKRMNIQKEQVIDKEFHKILDSCPVIVSGEILEDPGFNSTKGVERSTYALKKLFEKRYHKAILVNGASIPNTTEKLKAAIRRPVENGEYEGVNADLSPVEKEIEIYLNNQYGEVTVSDIVQKFSNAPWGWDSLATLYVLNELVRRHYRDYSYQNNPNVDVNTVASKLISETSKFTVRKAETISRELVNKFLDSWKYIFGQSSYLKSTDSTQIFREAKGTPESDAGLFKFRKEYREAEKKYGRYPFFAPVLEALELFDTLNDIKEPKIFFETVIDEKNKAHDMIDTVRQVLAFIRDQMKNYTDVHNFVRDNRENFNLLDEKYRQKIEDISKIDTQGWPIRMSDYLDLKDDLSVALDKIRKQLRGEIKEAYEKAYVELVEGAKGDKVDPVIVTKPDNIIFSKCQPDNIYVLQANRDVSAYFSAQAAKIQNAKPKPTPTPKPSNGGSEPKPYPNNGGGTSSSNAAEPNITNFELVTRTTAVISNETDVDNYLANLKAQMMAKINQGFCLTITR